MKIGSYDTTPAAAANATSAAAGDRKASAPQARAAGGAAEPSATVQLSSAAAAAASQGGDASFDAAKVERISQAIRDGSFQVNAEAIADKLIANAQEVLGRNNA